MAHLATLVSPGLSLSCFRLHSAAGAAASSPPLLNVGFYFLSQLDMFTCTAAPLRAWRVKAATTTKLYPLGP